jgi:hypothetical protein
MSTLVQIKRSTANSAPGSLLEGELAYSYVSNTLFIGDTASGVMNVGGKLYTDLIDGASAANGASTFVRRYANGSAQFQQLDINLSPTSNSHVATKEYVDQQVSGTVSLNSLTDVIVVGANADQNNRLLIGHANGQYITTGVTGNVTLSNTGVFTIGSDQVTNAMLVNDDLTVTAGNGLAGGGLVALGGSITLDVVAGDGISNTGDAIAVDSTVVRTSGTQTINGNKTFANTITFNEGINVTGNIILNGNTTYINVATLNVTDPLIYLGSNNTVSDTVDLGFIASKNSGGSVTHTGLARDASDGVYHLFDNLADNGHEGNILDFANSTYALLRANLDAQSANIDSLTVDTSLLVTGTATVTGDLTVSGGDIITTTATTNVANTNATTVNFAGAATTLKIGASGSTTTFAGDLNVDGGDLSGPSSFNLLNITTDIINFGGVANTINIGHNLDGGTVNVKSNLVASKHATVGINLVVGEQSEANVFISNRTVTQGPNLSNFDGERLRLYDFDQVGRPNYAIGVEGGHIWMGIDGSANNLGWKWYGNTSQAMRLSGNGVLEVANSIITDVISAGSLTLTTALAVGSGGTGKSSLTANGVMFANTTTSFDFATGTNGQVLQISAGVPTFAMLDGGSF